MKIFNAEQIRNWDAFTIKNEPISSIALMERAAASCVRWIDKSAMRKNRIVVVCGPGNNGGDGLAIARILHQKFYKLTCYVLNLSGKFSEDFRHNRKLLNKLPVTIIDLKTVDELDNFKLESGDVVIDAIFGSGLNRPATGLAGGIIEKINQQNSQVISIDVPSGMFCEDNSKNSFSQIVKANHTLCLGSPKLSFYLPPFGEATGRIHLLDIGLARTFYMQTPTPFHLMTSNSMRGMLKARDRFSHKGTYGHVSIVAGSAGKMGAAILAVSGALKTGAGLVSAHVPGVGLALVQQNLPEAMVEANAGDRIISGKISVGNRTTGVGPGIGQDPETASSLLGLLEGQDRPMVIDADALNIIAKDRAMMKNIPQGSILTPHPKEFERLAGKWQTEIEKLEKIRSFAKETGCIIVFKDAHTLVALPNGIIYINSTGNPGMATGGSGDVLTGMISSLLAQNYAPQMAACLGVYVHGLAGDIAMMKRSVYGMTAGDIVSAIPDAFTMLEQNSM